MGVKKLTRPKHLNSWTDKLCRTMSALERITRKCLRREGDQISFHTPSTVTRLPSPVVYKKANDSDPTKTSF